MKLQNSIALCLLALYSLVLVHNFVPHCHQSIHEKFTEHCCHHASHEQVADHDHEMENTYHEHETHIHCSFEEVLVLNKKTNLPTVYLIESSMIKEGSDEETKQHCDTYYFPAVTEPHCRDVKLRGPPQFS